MSADYLGRLAARALGSAIVLRPRVTNLWESTFETETRTILPEPSTAARLPARARPRASAVLAAPGATTHPPTAAPTTTLDNAPSEPQIATEETVVDSVSSRETAAHASDSHGAATALPGPVTHLAEPAIEIEEHHPRPVRERRLFERIERLRVREQRAPSRSQAIDSMPGTPTPIEITIGRIDVRAVTSGSPATARVPAPRAPMMSLREYLAQRDPRRRR